MNGSPCSPPFALKHRLCLSHVVLQQERKWNAVECHVSKSLHHGPSGNGVVGTSTVNGEHGRPQVETGQYLHHMRHALCPRSCGQMRTGTRAWRPHLELRSKLLRENSCRKSADQIRTPPSAFRNAMILPVPMHRRISHNFSQER